MSHNYLEIEKSDIAVDYVCAITSNKCTGTKYIAKGNPEKRKIGKTNILCTIMASPRS